MRYVDDWGQIVRMSERSFWKFLRDGAAGNNPSASDYGKVVGILDMHTIDIRPQDYKSVMESTSRRDKKTPAQLDAEIAATLSGSRKT